MKRHLLLLVAALFASLAPAQAQHHRPPVPEAGMARLDDMFTAADQGDNRPLRRAVETERDPVLAALIRGRLAAMWLEPAALDDWRLRRLADPRRPAGIRRAALSILTSAAFSQGRYGDAARFGAILLGLQRAAGEASKAEDTELTLGIARRLAPQPRLVVERRVINGATRARMDDARLTRIDLSINGRPQEAVFDTGANLSVLSAGTARRLGVRVLGGAASVGNSVAGNVPVSIAIADRVEIGGTVLRHAAFLVIDDAALTFPGGYTIPAILGFPEMRALGRMRMETGRRLVIEQPIYIPEPSSGDLRALDNDLVVDAVLSTEGMREGIYAPLHLDSGANPTSLSPTFAAAHPQVVAGLARVGNRVAGAGGSASGEAVVWRNVRMTLPDRMVTLPGLIVQVGGAGKPSAHLGTLGADVLSRFDSYTLDLAIMRLELGDPVAPAH